VQNKGIKAILFGIELVLTGAVCLYVSANAAGSPSAAFFFGGLLLVFVGLVIGFSGYSQDN
jgi:hypothetical protein